MPKRIQMSRQRPWRAENPDAVIVARPGRWGNPYAVQKAADGEWAVCWIAPDGDRIPVGAEQTRDEAFAVVLRVFRDLVLDGGGFPSVESLRGKDLACWCPLDQPCHADVLLDLANPKEDQWTS